MQYYVFSVGDDRGIAHWVHEPALQHWYAHNEDAIITENLQEQKLVPSFYGMLTLQYRPSKWHSGRLLQRSEVSIQKCPMQPPPNLFFIAKAVSPASLSPNYCNVANFLDNTVKNWTLGVQGCIDME